MEFGDFILPRPLHGLVGHRGASGYAPENTLASIQLAKDLGVNWVEIDVRQSKGGELVVFHDSTLERTTNGTGRVAARNVLTLKNLDAGIWFSPNFEGQKIPTLAEALKFISSLDLQVNLEVKCPANISPEKINDFSQKLVLSIQENWPKDKAAPLVSSFHLGFLHAFRTKAPLIPIGILSDKPSKNAVNLAKSLKNCTLNCAKEHVTKERLQELSAMNIPLMIYTVNDRAQGLELLQAGAFAIFSDTPDIFLKK